MPRFLGAYLVHIFFLMLLKFEQIDLAPLPLEQMKSGNNATNQNTSSTIESNRPPQPERNAPSTQQIFDLSDVAGEPILCLGEVKSQHQQAPNLSALKTVM